MIAPRYERHARRRVCAMPRLLMSHSFFLFFSFRLSFLSFIAD
jgi:hypothetical protein